MITTRVVGRGLAPRSRRQASLLAVVLVASSIGCHEAAAKKEKPAPVGLGELSAIVALDNGRFLVADDERGVLLVESDRTTTKLLAPLPDLEGLCALPDGRYAAIAEASGVVTAFTLDGKSSALGTLAHPPVDKPKKNKGWEGIAFLPDSLSFDKKPHLVAVHEGAPKAVALFAWPTLAHEETFVLSGALDDALGDLSDVSVDGKTGDLILVSDESRRIAYVTLAKGALSLGRMIDVPIAADEKAEGIAVDDKGAMWIATDATGRIVQLPATNAPAAPTGK